MKRRSMIAIAVAGLAAIAGLAAPQAQADEAAFFKGKTVRIVVGFSAGGGYDAYARLFARHIRRHPLAEIGGQRRRAHRAAVNPPQLPRPVQIAQIAANRIFRRGETLRQIGGNHPALLGNRLQNMLPPLFCENHAQSR